jgi:dTDP-4-dehydrorhamnose reductase
MDQQKILVTGGSGLLGSELKQLMPQAYFPNSKIFDVTNYESMRICLEGKQIQTIVHCAALTSPPVCDKEPLKALETNIVGTANVVKLCIQQNIKLIYISTDYVFRGDQGNYREDDPVYPVNKYAWSKLGGECAVRMHDNSLIIRTSFGPNVFPYQKAFVDQWTSRESVEIVARKIRHILDLPLTGTIHIGGPRRTVFEYAKQLDSSRQIGEISIKEVSFRVPVDTSLDTSRYQAAMDSK